MPRKRFVQARTECAGTKRAYTHPAQMQNLSGHTLGRNQVTHPATHPPKQQVGAKKPRSKTMRQRRIPDLWANDRLYERAYHLLKDTDPKLRLTIYRLKGDQRLKPAILRCQAFPMDELCDYLRDKLGGGEFCIMVRRGKVMALGAAVSIAPLPGLRMPILPAEYSATRTGDQASLI